MIVTEITSGGLERDIVVDVTTLDHTATSKHMIQLLISVN